ncbi:MAG: hypothetical protein IKN17_08070 [Ruminococcus sp.]|nr:hypothetical protein [Ruminococcus sp.]
MELSNKVAYLKGLMEGLGIDESTNEGKILKAMADILAEMAESVEDLAVEVDEAVDLLDTIDEDLGQVEEDLYGDDDDDEDEDEDGDESDFDEVQYECVCPTCGDTIYLDEGVVEEGSIDCPNCGEKLEFDFEPDDDSEE